MDGVLVGCPTYNGLVHVGTASRLWGACGRSRRCYVVTNGKSLLSANCNSLLSMAWNEREQMGLGWFAMLHADIEPDLWWVDTLIRLAEEREADFVSAVVPIKDERGITSTALGDGRIPVFGRLSQRQVRDESFPKTFDVYEAINALYPFGVDASHCRYLLANTGCMVLRLAGDPVAWFANEDGVQKVGDKWQPWDYSEDWLFTQTLADAGKRVICTTEVGVVHHGSGMFPSHKTWGSVTNDFTIREQEFAR